MEYPVRAGEVKHLFLSFCVPLSVSASLFPRRCFPPSCVLDRAREEWTVKGDDLLLSRSQHYKAPCPLWLLTLMWARKKTPLLFRGRQSDQVRVCKCVSSTQTQVCNQTELWLLGRCATTNCIFVRQTREETFSAWLPWWMAPGWMKEETESDSVCLCGC